MIKKQLYYFFLLFLLFAACNGQEKPDSHLFTLLDPAHTSIYFSNDLAENKDFNILKYLYYYNGGGVAVGDVNNDGLPDLYFTANELPNKLYLNKGNFRFEDITAQAQVAGQPGWTTGVTMADVNSDGWLDIYVSQLDGYEGITGYNQLYINNADTTQAYPTFTEKASEYRLDHKGFSTQATFFDYDLDGDLDVYLLSHTVHSADTYVPVAQGRRRSKTGDKLLRNDHGKFTDVSEKAGIYGSVVGYGLSVSVADINQDGYPDIYVSNDFHENDYLYYNNGDGTFTESLEKVIGHTSRFSMGNDIADFNNDTKPDLVVLDMKPEDERVLKTSAGEDPYDIYQFKLKYGYHHQYARNTLQLNVGDSLYSEIGQLAGISATDWSWAALFADLDLDGWKDLFITNGIYRRPNNLDYTKFIATADAQHALQEGNFAEHMNLIQKMPSEKVSNYVYQNNGAYPEQEFTFTNQAEAWGLAQPGFSNGAAYADLDNDGDLDLIVNNINSTASIYRNNTREQTENNYLKIKFAGKGKNTQGIGAKIYVYASDQVQHQEMMPTRGFQSSVEPAMIFGLGKQTKVDSVVVIWPGAGQQILKQVDVNQTLHLKQEKAITMYDYNNSKAYSSKLFHNVTHQLNIDYRHQENAFVDFNREALMPHMLSQEGPALAVGDINGDGLDDFYIGGAKGHAGSMVLQQKNGKFKIVNDTVWQKDYLYEDVDAVFFDADNDQDADMYVASAGNEFSKEGLEDRIYINDGNGNFTRSMDTLPEFYGNTSCVSVTDYDQDGDLDLFIGSRVVTGSYGLSPASYILENDGQGNFKDVTLEIAPELAQLGMVTDAVWSDYDQDGKEDLIIVGEWMPVTVFRNISNQLQKVKPVGLEQSHGWWNTIVSADLDQDGDMDFVAGNLGLNSVIQAKADEPATLHIQDFDNNGSLDQILSFYKNGVSYPLVTKDELTKQIVPLRKKFIKYSDYAKSTVEDIFSPQELQKAVIKKVYNFASCIVENTGDGKFIIKPLPTRVQFSTINAIVTDDYNQDGHLDLLIAGNSYAIDPKQGRYDASYGLLLRGDGKGNFHPVETGESGFVVKGEIKALKHLHHTKENKLIIAATNNDHLQILKYNENAVF